MRVAGAGNRIAGENRAAEDGLDDQAPPQRFKDHGNIKAAAAKAAMVFAEQGG